MTKVPLSEKVAAFAARMRKIPRKLQRCGVYGTLTVVVDRAHALNIFRKCFPGVKDHECYDALLVLQERLDTEVNPAQGWRA